MGYDAQYAYAVLKTAKDSNTKRALLELANEITFFTDAQVELFTRKNSLRVFKDLTHKHGLRLTFHTKPMESHQTDDLHLKLLNLTYFNFYCGDENPYQIVVPVFATKGGKLPDDLPCKEIVLALTLMIDQYFDADFKNRFYSALARRLAKMGCDYLIED